VGVATVLRDYEVYYRRFLNLLEIAVDRFGIYDVSRNTYYL